MSVVTLDEHPTWQEIVLSFAPAEKRKGKSSAYLRRLPLGLILLLQAILTWRLSDITLDDEALYIDAGHDFLQHLVHGIFMPDYGTYLSGAPAAYPVPAALLDSLGGLALVRLFSLVCLLTCTVCIYRSSRHLFGERAALFSSLLFVLNGSVQFVGKLATYDAPCLALVAVAFCVAVTKRSDYTGIIVGSLLALAAITKYAGAGFAPFVLAICLVADDVGFTSDFVRSAMRTMLGALTTAGILIVGYRLWGGSIAAGIRFTTTSRKALDYQSDSVLIRSVAFDIGLLSSLAILATVLLIVHRMRRNSLISILCLAAGAFLPLSQIRINEFTSLDKHTAFSALFLSVPAGYALDWAFSKKGRARIATVLLVWIMLVDGLWRSQIQYSWPSSLLKTLTVVEEHPGAGTYLSTDGDSLRYYSKAHLWIKWEPSAFAYAFFAESTSSVLSAISSDRFEGIVYQTGGVTSAVSDTYTQMTRFLAHDPDYRLLAKIAVDPYQKTHWYVWQLRSGVNARAPN